MNNKLMSKALCIKIGFVKASLFSEQITKHYSPGFAAIYAKIVDIDKWLNSIF